MDLHDSTADLNKSYFSDFHWAVIYQIWSLTQENHNLLFSGGNSNQEAKCQRDTESKTRKRMAGFFEEKKELNSVYFGEHQAVDHILSYSCSWELPLEFRPGLNHGSVERRK